MPHYRLFVVALIAIVATAAAAPVDECRDMAEQSKDGWCQMVAFGGVGDGPHPFDGKFITLLPAYVGVDIYADTPDYELVTVQARSGPYQLKLATPAPVDIVIAVQPRGGAPHTSCISRVVAAAPDPATRVHYTAWWSADAIGSFTSGVEDGTDGNGKWYGSSWITPARMSDMMTVGTNSTAEMRIAFIEICHQTGRAAADALNAQA